MRRMRILLVFCLMFPFSPRLNSDDMDHARVLISGTDMNLRGLTANYAQERDANRGHSKDGNAIVIWASGTNGKILRSADSGKTWKECGYTTGQPGQTLNSILDIFNLRPKSDASIAVHPTRSDIVAAGFKDAALSTDGGKTWTALNNLAGWHPDIHELLFRDEPFSIVPNADITITGVCVF